MVNGITFSEQLTTSADFAHFQNTFLNRSNGITKGCEISQVDGNVYVQKGYFVVCGRFVRVVGVETIPTPEVLSGQLYCTVVFEVDLTKINTPEEFGQGYFRVLQSVSGYPELTQEDLDNDGTLYQMPWCQLKKGVDGIQEFRDLREIMNLGSVWEAVATQNGTYKGEFDLYFTAQKVVIEQMIEELEGEGYLTLEDASKILNVTLSVDSWSENAMGLYEQKVAVEGIAASDMAVLLKYTRPEVLETDSINYGADFSKISGGQASDGNMTFYSISRLDNDITVALALGKKGDGRLLMGGGGSSEKQQISNVVMTITDNAAVAEGGTVTAECNNKSWTSTIKNGKAKLYASEVGNYLITVTTTDGIIYTAMLVCPYFGQFSTDIYSGTLIVTCTEAGGNGKSCNVRSCDDDYNPTDAYNLTQTFDTGLELTFLGIPSGKHLITVDDKYVFFKSVESIQNINSVNVELKQWLYRNGEEFPWNTGGWMKCLVKGTPYTGTYNGYPSTGATTCQASLAGRYMTFSGTIKASPTATNASTGGKKVYVLGGGLIDMNIGTKKPHPISIAKYSNLKIKSSSVITECIRTGSGNSSNSNTSTATVLLSGSGNLTIALANSNPYIIVGHKKEYKACNGPEYSNKLDYSYSCTVTEIWIE